ncbi:hypothetical protein KCMC57_up45610 [Kitasatospora sp. CMC57]|uniref:Uncharacterized protein n=1 Tax=Kitasatospora sp. CMC57 TaxID=3231513 RepID=A0AB33K048_9ACTN
MDSALPFLNRRAATSRAVNNRAEPPTTAQTSCMEEKFIAAWASAFRSSGQRRVRRAERRVGDGAAAEGPSVPVRDGRYTCAARRYRVQGACMLPEVTNHLSA